ncbi:hypothetical protein [Bradyrhizobium sp. Ash2021]|uniref:hypothetical protein n=1 Tax=Bradyrhizobium sp. Ash2021 TaxID=2954771 RepID=UPI002815E7C6|nr:hypothetical protein [Bradyrhizobium sp. Ash2021]WMT76278.1 hypothetical protein NL528_07870 [Bradyrhizobium sp. Ash2021]
MTPAEFVAREKDRREVSAWLLRLVPPNGRGSPLTDLPPELIGMLKPVFPFTLGSAPDMYRALMEDTDWARDAYARLAKNFPADVSTKLQLSDLLAVGAVHDAEFNGFVEDCRPGHAICVPNGALMLMSFAAELYSLNLPPLIQQTVILGDYCSCGFEDRPQFRTMRALRRHETKDPLASLYPDRIAGELDFLFKNYSEMGVAGPPSFFSEFGIMPLFPNQARFGHPLETGNHLREHAIRFLLLHECGHVLNEDFGEGHSHDDEFAADERAFELGIRSAKCRQAVVASLLGALLVLAIGRRLEAFERNATSSHPPARQRLDRLLAFVRNTALLGFFQRRFALHCLRELERRDALLAETSKDYREWARSTNTITTVIEGCLRNKSDADFMDQLPRWLVQAPPSRIFSVIAASRIEFERRLQKNPDDEDAAAAIRMLMKIYDAAGDNTTSTLSMKLQNAYSGEIRRSARSRR